MVQALTAATLVLTATTALAAPILDETVITREPSFWKTLGNDLKKVGNGIGNVVNTVGTVAQGVNSAVDVKNGISSLRGKRDFEVEDLSARDPSFGSFIKGIGKDIGKVAGAVAPIAGVASKFIREEPVELTARDIELLQELAARDPSFGSFIKGLGKDIGKVASTVAPIASVATKFIREEEDLAARDPSFGSFIKGIGKDIGKVAQTVAPIASVATKFIREEDALTARDIELIEELAARDPSFGSFIKGLGKDIGKVAGAVAPIAGVASKFIREEPVELTARDIELLEELAARDPSFGSFIKGIGKDIGKVAQTVAPIASVATKFIREEEDLAARDPSFGSFIKGIGKDIGKVAQTVAPIASVATKFIREEDDLAARDPSFGSFIKGIGKDIGKVAQTVAPIASVATKFIREEPVELTARDIQILEELMARDPSFGSFIKGLGKDIGKVASTVVPIASKFIREEPEFVARSVSLEELD